MLVFASVLVFLSFVYTDDALELNFYPAGLAFKSGEKREFFVQVRNPGNYTNFTVYLVGDGNHLEVEPSVVEFTNLSECTKFASIRSEVYSHAEYAGYGTILANGSEPKIEGISTNFIHVTVFHSEEARLVILFVGWIYFVAWSLSFYPQILNNARRKSVVGFNFDFLALNIIGHISYLSFNAGLFWFPYVQHQYFSKHKYGVNPVQLNDVLFSIHAVMATQIQAIQCCIYDRGNQSLSKVCRVLLGCFLVFVVTCLILTLTDVITWLSYLYYFSYVKLGITFMKYCPQVYYNYTRKSTEGFSIGYAILDFVGGTQSMLQMFLIAYNYDDWSSISGDLSKLGLGLLSACFDVVFMVQHFCLYGNKNKMDVVDAVYANHAFDGTITKF